MRFVICAAVQAALVLGCGSHGGGPAVPQVAAAPAATRWVPDKPTYVLASATVTEAQRDLREAIDLLAAVTGVELRELASVAQGLLGVDILQPDALAAIGVDVRGSWAMFSADVSPTFVVHLTAPDQMKAFLDHQRARGLVTQSVVVDGTDVVSAPLIHGVTIRWAIAGDWLWVHLSLPVTQDDPARWFTTSHAAHGTAWAPSWAWAAKAAGTAAGLVGFLDLHGVVADLAARLPDAVACVKLAPSLGRLGFGMQGDEHHMATRLALEIGPTAELARHILPPPSGWTAAAGPAALAVQWNLDLTAARTYLAPCLAAAGRSLAVLDGRGEAPAGGPAGWQGGFIDDTGVRAARVMLLGFDPDSASGTGALALDLASPAFFAHQLDRIPLRSTLERAQSFGGHKGFTVDIPFSITIEYVLEQGQLAAALGEGILAKVFAPAAPAGPPPIFALDISPPALTAEAWGILLQGAAEHRLPGSAGPAAKRAAAHLMRWRAGHLAVTAEGDQLVLSASGDR